ncbi:ornithine carbamoyltransferase [Desulfocurvibacter africanus]|uniref:Ornithine carbamoyltransferase n=1 Tax=Desulfocurvibacter africanus subsp. africanus str. Walvis Bay TaxID=690850 RepID=F3Z1A7_DESAF|nr:ornithine carbamoyltransferase [Desulfocurvibacter africanus]EGJ51110.1 Ornithine carbamoyltransferase [Desulfocurvibacter africanus subsp. africanus str. Walvis Bay]
MPNKWKHFLDILDMPRSQSWALVTRAKEMKDTDHRSQVLAGKVLVMIFEKASTRTRLSFEMAVRHLGGDTIFMTPHESQLGRSEPLKDTARVISRYCAGMIVRTFGQEKLEELAEYASVPVVNALSDLHHPCQVLSDLLTMYERTPSFKDLKVAWIGDGNNMAHSWINAAIYFPFYLSLAVPKGFEPDARILNKAVQLGARIHVSHEPKLAMDGAHYVNTDVWASMGQESEQGARSKPFANFQVNDELLKLADPEVKVMHCLPAHRGEEITDEVMEGPASIVWDQAENRLHMQKAILEWVFGHAPESTAREFADDRPGPKPFHTI